MVGWTLAGWCTIATAQQTVYKWTDEAGVVHFSDQPPPKTTNVEERHLPAPPAAKQPGESAESDTGAGAGGAAEAEGSTPKSTHEEGPARVIVVSHEAPRVGPSALHVIGKVQNVGGANAGRVAVTISALDNTQATPCLNEEAPVTPSTLRPGESGNFDVDVDSPCLVGEPSVDVTAVWD